MTEELYINGQLVDLPNDSVIALSYAVNTLFDVKTVQGNVSNNITLPPTSKNLKILGFPNLLNIDLSKTVRRKATARYVQSGIEILPKGIVKYGTINKKGVGIIVASGNVDFFDLIDGSINKLNLSAYDHTFDFNSIPPSRLNRVGYVYPVINYGDLTNASDHINLRTMRPATFVKTVIDNIVKETGFKFINTLETHIRTRDHYKNMVLPFSLDNFSHGQRAIDELDYLTLEAEGTAPYEYIFPNGVEWTEVYSCFNTVIRDDSNSFSLNQKYTSTAEFIADISITIRSAYIEKFFFSFGGSKDHNWVDFNIHVNSVVVGTTRVTVHNYGDGGTGIYTHQQDNVVVTANAFKIHVGDQIQLAVHTINDGGIGNALVRVYPPIDFTIKPVISEVQYGEVVQLEATLPDISKKDFLKAIANIFGGIIQTDNENKTVTIVPFFKIKDNVAAAVDWSDRIVNPDDEAIVLSLGEYSQTNVGAYDNDDVISPPEYASASIKIADENLSYIEKELFTLPFSASIDGKVLSGIRAITIKKIEALGQTDFTVSTGARIALVDFIDGPVLTYKDDMTPGFSQIESTSIPQTFFATPFTGDYDMLMQSIFDRYFKDISVILNDQRKLSIPMRLKQDDIKKLDFFIPVYLRKYATYFYISKINSYVAGKPCNVDLIKLF